MDGNRRLRKANQTVNTSKASVVEPTKEKVASLVKEKQSTMARTQLDRLSEVSGVPQNPTRKGGSTELNLNLGLEDPDDDSDADLSPDEQRDMGSTPRSENRLKRKVF
ncbi:hypothetical protein VPH35_097311 [Triticum aestivum]|uniref:Uncharacterized protein n=1 Tax=Aegilops tauschii subsp. strangulata TaxID=200361 RepID=A0A453KJS8_AEGTS